MASGYYLKRIRQESGNQAAKRPLYLHPAFLFTAAWSAVAALYAMHLSKLLIYSNQEMLSTTALIIFPYLFSLSGVLLLRRLLVFIAPLRGRTEAFDEGLLERRLNQWLKIWLGATVIEIVVSGGVPILWLLAGNGKTYFDFGIPSLHGFLNAMILTISLCHMALFAKYGGKRHLIVPVLLLFWSLIVITRNMMVINILQCGLIWLRVKAVKASTIALLLVVCMAVLLVFGFVGDMRTGAKAFRELAQPTANYPDWLPSGVLWAYIYLTTPVNNLIYTEHVVKPADNLLFPNTTALLLPSVIRDPLLGDQASSAGDGDLVTQAFNVSTAFAGPYQDYGKFGMVCFSVLIAFLAAIYWANYSFRFTLIYTVIGQCLLLTIFYNHFFYLPIITQIGWLYIFFRKGKVPSRGFEVAKELTAN